MDLRFGAPAPAATYNLSLNPPFHMENVNLGISWAAERVWRHPGINLKARTVTSGTVAALLAILAALAEDFR